MAVVFIWIGALRLSPHEADSIVSFVTNNPVTALFYRHPDQCKVYLTREEKFERCCGSSAGL